MKDYLILIAAVASAGIAFVSFLFFTIFCSPSARSNAEEYEAEYPDGMDKDGMKTVLRVATVISCAVLIVTATFTLWSYKHLSTERPDVLDFFAKWYIIGFLSRFLLLVKRHAVMSPVLATEWESVFGALVWAVLGPIATLQTIYAYLFEKNFWEKR